MRHSKMIVLLLALLLCLSLSVTALAGEKGPLWDLWHGGSELLFHTDNVTLDGHAVFFLDGDQFKEARLHYVQEGYESFYNLSLLTPRFDGSQKETGFTIIADETGKYDLMEVFEPGVYRVGTDLPQNSLLTRSHELDALVSLGDALIPLTESLIPEGTLVAEESQEGKIIHLDINGEQLPDVAKNALNLGAEFFVSRWFYYGYDRSVILEQPASFDNYLTPTQALTDGTCRWEFKSAKADIALDSEGRLAAAKGTVQLVSVYWDGVERQVDVNFDFSAGDYGQSAVKPFDPADYGVTLKGSFHNQSVEEWMSVETEELPPYSYTGEDSVEAAVVEYTAQIGRENYLMKDGAVTIPAPLIFKTEPTEEGGFRVYGNFWVFNYILDGDVLKCISGGENPGVITLTKDGDGWAVASMETAGDGEDYDKDIRSFCQGDEDLELAYYESDCDFVRLRLVQEYVEANHVNAVAFQDYGWDPVSLISAPEEEE